MARVVFRKRWRLGDGWTLLALALAAGGAFGWLGWSIDADERAAEAARSGHAARVLVTAFEGMPELSWEARSPLVARLARAVGPQVKLAVVTGTPGQARPFEGNRAYDAHSDPARIGKRLVPARPSDARLMSLLQSWTAKRTTSAVSGWNGQRAEALMVRGTPAVAVYVEGVAPSRSSRRAFPLAAGAFGVVLVLCGSLMGWFHRVGPWLSTLVLAAALWVTAALATELDATLWTGRGWRPACDAVAEAGFPAAAREICTNLAPTASRVEASTFWCAGLAAGLFALFLLVRMGLAWRAAWRDRREAAAAAGA